MFLIGGFELEEKYRPDIIEPKWQKVWEEKKAFEVEVDPNKAKYYLLEMFPYPSGRLHMGHVRNYSIGDLVSRCKAMQGANVIHPMGWDAFGLPAENAAIENRTHPAKWTSQNIDNMKSQLKRLGYSYDWRREFATCDPTYYKWEQMIFLKMLEKGLAYKSKSWVNWCPRCNTVLANEQVEGGYCWRHPDTLVEQKMLSQWFFKITAYAEELLAFTDKLPGWPEKVLTMQKNWIGKSIGAFIHFPLEKTYADPEGKEKIDKIIVYTTRQDTVFGATFMSIAAEHPYAEILSKGTSQEKAVAEFCKRVRAEDKFKRAADDYKKEGVFTGAYCLNPMTGRKIPGFVANFVLMEYGTGCVMAVPAHDQRDFDFAKVYNLEIIPVVQPQDQPHLDGKTMTAAYVDEGVMINSGQYNGMKSEEFRVEIANRLEKDKKGGATINYKIRDWLISRQRYWGAPIPMVYCDKCGIVPVPEKELPVELPLDVAFDPSITGNPLANAESWVKTKCPKCKGPAKRETDTMDTFVESSWYFDRFCCAKYDQAMFDPKQVNYWMPVDQYIGGIEHAVLHLLYARFYTKVLRDFGLLKIDEPFTRLLTQGMVIKESFSCPGHGALSHDKITKDNKCGICGAPVGEKVIAEGKPAVKVCKGHGYFYPEEVPELKCPACGLKIDTGRKEKMSKSKKNIIDPQELIEKYGADTVRLFCLFAAPPDKEIDWSDEGVMGCYRFLNRIYTLVYRHRDKLMSANAEERFDFLSGPEDEAKIYRKLNRTIKDATERIDRFIFNTAISAMMELYNEIGGFDPEKKERDAERRYALLKKAVETILVMLNPFAPHLCEELWRELGNKELLANTRWPVADESALSEQTFLLVVQVNGKVRARIEAKRGASEKEILAFALSEPNVRTHIEGKSIKKSVYVPDKLLNLVVG